MARALAFLTTPRALLRLEGVATLAVAIALYDVRGGNWALFAVLLLVPDLSMLGYGRARRLVRPATTLRTPTSRLSPSAASGLQPGAWSSP